MINKSLWFKGLNEKKENELKEDHKTDILIIGGGITGLSTAYHLKDSNLKITIIEADSIACDTTGKSTGKVSYVQGYLLNNIKKIHGINKALEYLESQQYACKLIRDIIVENNIKCNYESNSTYLFTDKNNQINKIKENQQIIPNSIEKKDLPIKFPCRHSIKVSDTAVINPVKYVYGLKKICLDYKINIYESTKAIDIKKTDNGYICYTPKAKIYCNNIVLACHYPAFMENIFLPFQTEIQKSFVVAGNTNKNKMFNAIDTKDDNSIRYYTDTKDYLIYSSETKLLSKNIDNKKAYDNIFWKMQTKLVPDIKYAWFNSDLMTNDFLPLIGYVEENNNSLLVGTGYNGSGITNGSLAGKVLSDLILGKDNKYINLFKLSRKTTIPRIINLITYNIHGSYSYVLSKVKNHYSFYPKNVYTFEKNNIRYGVYIDEKNKKHIVKNTCPHMKCNLIFNTVDKTWDCPCHASRFTIDGKVIKGPAVYSIKVDKNN